MSAVPFFVLAIDQANSSGWSVVHAPTARVLAFGLAKTPAERAAAVAEGIRLAVDAPLRVLFEDHSRIPLGRGGSRDFGQNRATRDTGTILGMGAARGRWEERFAMVGLPRAHYSLDVQPRVWRKAVLGTSSGGRDALKALAVRYASACVGRPLVSDDIAEAICMGVWGARTMMVSERARRLKASG